MFTIVAAEAFAAARIAAAAEGLVKTIRRFTSKHVSTSLTVADSEAEAIANIQAEIEAGAHDPSDDYAEQIDGYDDAGAWEVTSAEITNGS